MKMFDFLTDRGVRVILEAIPEPPASFSSAKDVFEKTLEHEQFVTSSIHRLMTLAIDERDYATQAFLQWYVSEQVEEESNVNDVLSTLRMVGSDKGGLMMIDQKLASRPAPTPLPVK